jgi:gas vesicle protein
MGFGDRLKELRDQAQSAVAENKDKIQGAVAAAGEAANTKTKGKYADKIAKVGEKVSSSVEKIGVDAQEPGVNAETTVAEVPEAPEELIHPETAQAAKPATPAAPPDFDE